MEVDAATKNVSHIINEKLKHQETCQDKVGDTELLQVPPSQTKQVEGADNVINSQECHY